MKQGYVITRNRNLKEFFNAANAYDRVVWRKLDEATTYHSSSLGQAAVAKLWRTGNFAAKLVPLSEIDLQLELPKKDDVNMEPGVGDKLGEPDKPSKPGEDNVEMKADGGEGEQPCEKCGQEPCTCPCEKCGGSPCTCTPDTCPHCGGELQHSKEECELTKVPMSSIPGQEQEERAYSPSRFFKMQDVMWKGKKYHVVDDSGTGVATIAPRGDTSGKNNIQVKNNELLKEGVAGKCNCKCHTDKNVKHVAACCKQCPHCKKDIAMKGYEAHKTDCKSMNEAEFKMPAKPELDAQPEENDDMIPNLKEPKINDLTYKDPDVINQKPDTDLTTATALPHGEKVKVPAEVMSSLGDAIEEFKKCANFNNGRDDIEGSFCMTVVNALEELEADLDVGTVEGIKQAQIKMSSWMNPITTNIPELVRDFVYRGGRKPSLKDLFDIKKGEKQLDAVRGGLNYPKGQKN